MTFSWDKFSEKATEWLFQQGVSTILLCAILGWLAWVSNYALNTAIPGHISQMQAGYKEEHDRFDANLERVISVIERAADRTNSKTAASK